MGEQLWTTGVIVAVEAVIAFLFIMWFRRMEVPKERRTLYAIAIGAVSISLIVTTVLIGHYVGGLATTRPESADLPVKATPAEPAGPTPEIESNVESGSMEKSGDDHREALKAFEGK